MKLNTEDLLLVRQKYQKQLVLPSIEKVSATQLAEELSMRGFNIAFDADCENPKTKEMILKLAEKAGAKVFWLHINPPEDFILNKLRTYDHMWLFKNGEEAVENYYRQKQKRLEEETHSLCSRRFAPSLHTYCLPLILV